MSSCFGKKPVNQITLGLELRTMISNAAPATRKLQRWLKPLEQTPLHPQWLVLRHRTETKSWVKRHAHGIVVDIGCGNGRLREQLGDTVRYIGIDYPTTIALGYSGTADIHANATELPIATASIDTVILLDVLEHLDAPDRAIAEASRVLRSGGKLLIHVPCLYPLHDEPHDYQRWTRHGLKCLLQQHGLDIEEIRESTTPLETAAALFSIALSKAILDAIRYPGPTLLLIPPILFLIPIINITGWILSSLMPSSPFMPFSYRVSTIRKIATEGTIS